MKQHPFRRHRIPPKLADSRRLGYAAWRADDAAARLAIPPAPPDPLPGDELQRWTFAGPGWSVDVSLQYIGRHARSDQYRVLIDGREWSPCAGVADVLAHIRRDVLPRTASKRERDEIAREDYRAAAASQASHGRTRMLHYHGTPITPRAQLERMAGRMFCVSFAAPQDLATCLRIGQSVMLDNGAFSVFTRGAKFHREGFYAWIEPHLGHPHWAVVPDEIGGTVEQQRAMVKTWPHRKEYGAPVWHLGLPLEYLFDLCNDWPRVCIGSSGEFWQVGSAAWCGRMDQTFNALVQQFGRVPWLHGLRMLGQASGPWPIASADSTNVGRNFKNSGSTTCAECMAQRIDSTNPPTLWTERPIQKALC